MMDFILQAWVSSIIERKKASWILGKGERWAPGKKLKLLFAGYNGARNMGSDARVEEMIRQLRHVLRTLAALYDGDTVTRESLMQQLPKELTEPAPENNAPAVAEVAATHPPLNSIQATERQALLRVVSASMASMSSGS